MFIAMVSGHFSLYGSFLHTAAWTFFLQISPMKGASFFPNPFHTL